MVLPVTMKTSDKRFWKLGAQKTSSQQFLFFPRLGAWRRHQLVENQAGFGWCVVLSTVNKKDNSIKQINEDPFFRRVSP